MWLIVCLVFGSSKTWNGPDEIEVLINQGHLQQAEYEISSQLLNDEIDAEQQIKLLSLNGDVWFYRKNFFAAQRQYKAALKRAITEHNYLLQAEQMKNIAITFSEMTDYGEALRWHELAMQTLIKSQVGDEYGKQTKLSILLSQGIIFSYVGATELAMETLSEAQSLAYETNHLNALNNAYLRMAALYFENKRFDLSLSSLASINLNAFETMSDYAWFYGLKFNLFLATKDWSGAEKLVDEVMNHQMQWTDEFLDEIKVLQTQLSLAQKQFNQAEKYIRELSTSDSHSDSWLVSYLIGSKLALENSSIDALNHFQNAINQYLNHQGQLTKQQAISKVPTDLFTSAIKVTLSIGSQDDEMLFNWLQWAAKDSYLVSQDDTEFIGQQDTAAEGMNEVVHDVMHNHFFVPFNHFSLKALQSVLKSKEGVLLYHQFDHELMVFLIKKDYFQSVKLSTDGLSVQFKVANFINQINQQGTAWEDTSQQLESILLNPLRDYGLDSLTHLHIIPDENLRFLPFELLMDEQGEMVIDRFQLVTNSFSGLSQLIKHRKHQLTVLPKQTRLSFVGTNNNLSDIPSYWRTAYRNLEFTTKDYQGIQQEQKFIESLNMPGQSYFKQYATESVFIDLVKHETGILHVSSHGFDNPVAPAFSALVLNPDTYSDGLMQAREVVQYQSNLSLLVLASCSSAKGGLSGRYGNQLGLADAFVQAGVQGVIGTLWDVKDQATAEFMQWFYQSLSIVQVPAIALRETKIKARNAGWPAKDWSAFVMLGDNSTVVKMKPYSNRNSASQIFIPIIVSCAVILLVMVVFSLFNNRRLKIKSS